MLFRGHVASAGRGAADLKQGSDFSSCHCGKSCLLSGTCNAGRAPPTIRPLPAFVRTGQRIAARHELLVADQATHPLHAANPSSASRASGRSCATRGSPTPRPSFTRPATWGSPCCCATPSMSLRPTSSGPTPPPSSTGSVSKAPQRLLGAINRLADRVTCAPGFDEHKFILAKERTFLRKVVS